MITNQHRPKELIRAEILIDDAKVIEAHELLDNFERREGLTLHDKVSSQLLRADLLYQQGLYKKGLSLIQQTLKESVKLGKSLQTVDCFIHMANYLSALGNPENILDGKAHTNVILP